ncbi:MAG: phenylalanine--tRNA ligase subunit beta [Campylobacterales bacterium]|nr:phenylalanine--tRNA ligase subunit beta [Campylobacterales bacterium]
MIVTRSWLNEFIDLSDVSNEKLYETFNSIGLEVDSIKTIEIPQKVVIGKILSCEKHPDADKLNVCQIDVGSGTRQIVCGAANVVNAEYVAVATIGAVLPGDFEIKHAKLRGVESEGMVCSATELGLPPLGEGIMILDESIGELVVGKEFGEYEKIADTIIEIELTANRGDCLSIYGIARDLSVALEKDIKPFDYKQEERMKLGIAREAEIHTSGEMEADLRYKLASIEEMQSSFIVALRLALVDIQTEGLLSSMLSYAIHATGVILRAYDSECFRNEEGKIVVRPTAIRKGIIEVRGDKSSYGIVGVNQLKETIANDDTKQVLFEASYINPERLVDAVYQSDMNKDELYYKTSRGSSPDLSFGLVYLACLMDKNTQINCYEGSLDVHVQREKNILRVNVHEINDIIGQEIEINRIVSILKHLGFDINAIGDHVITAAVPMFRHDIVNIQDIAEEIVRIVGINHIKAKPLAFVEKNRLNDTTNRYKYKKTLKNRAVGVGFFENVSYVFSEKSVLERYGFITVEESLELTNPIVEELNTLRSTILVNLLAAVKRNVSYTKKLIPLFEIGAVFDAQRQQKEVISFVFTGYTGSENVSNSGKPKLIDFAAFIQKIGSVVGAFELVPCTFHNGLLHPYQSADILVDGKVCGFVSKLHPTVQQSYGIPDTFVAEVDLDALLPKHTNARAISRYQGVYKDLSIVIDQNISYYEVAKALGTLDLPMLKDSYPVDIYVDEKLGDKKSLTIRFFIQSMEKTLEEGDIETVMSEILETLKVACKAELR